MTNKPSPASAPRPGFASELASKMAQSLFESKWDGLVEIRHALSEPGDDDFIEDLPDEMLQTVAKRSWEAPETSLAHAMTEAEIMAEIRAGRDCQRRRQNRPRGGAKPGQWRGAKRHGTCAPQIAGAC
ncbi:hypothetical protein, partial [Roseovarius sp. D0-M9]|uniref:hypothetical protein n=1 Tax=Roseovarius sp. D0-M9 TaxID=3127117 RepID=UPI00300FA8DA